MPVLIEPWQDVACQPQNYCDTFVNQLYSDLTKGHPLYAIPVTLVASNDANDDILVALLEDTLRIAQVHLTWSKSPQLPPFPLTPIYQDIHQLQFLRNETEIKSI